MKNWRTMLLAASLAALAACGAEEEPVQEAGMAGMEQEDMPMEGMPGMAGMPGMEGTGAMPSGAMMDQMRTHMQTMRGAGADSLAAVMPMHRQMLANMIAQMNREMRDMNMTGDPAWNATVDSLRADLRVMPEMTAEEMQAMMDSHRARIERMMQMHAEMMERMPM